MRRAIQGGVVLVVLGHGLIHLLGAAKGFGWEQMSQLKEPISFGMGALWLVAGVLVIAAGVLLGTGIRSWWVIGGVAVAVSQGVIFTSWSDAAVGTGANAVLLAAVVDGFASHGQRSYRAECHRLVTTAPAQPVHRRAGQHVHGVNTVTAELVFTEGEFAYVESHLDQVDYNTSSAGIPAPELARAGAAL